MYKYNVKYTNSKNEVITLGKDSGVWLDENDLFNYEWDYVTAQRKLVATSRDVSEIPVKLLFLNGEDDSTINHFLQVMDYDARMKQPGTLTVNGYDRRGVFVSGSTEDYMYKRGLMYRDMRFLALDQDWTKRNVETLEPQIASSEEEQMQYPHDYPHDYGGTVAPSSFVNPSSFPSEFLLRIYGPCTDPYVLIGNNLYAVNCTVQEGGFLVIDSTDRSAIYNYNAAGVAQNVFDAATMGAEGSGQYIYELIPPGTNQVSWPNNFKLDIETLEAVSVPPAWSSDEQ